MLRDVEVGAWSYMVSDPTNRAVVRWYELHPVVLKSLVVVVSALFSVAVVALFRLFDILSSTLFGAALWFINKRLLPVRLVRVGFNFNQSFLFFPRFRR